MIKANEIVPIVLRLTQLEEIEYELLVAVIMENGKVRDGTPEFLIIRFEHILRKKIEITQALLN